MSTTPGAEESPPNTYIAKVFGNRATSPSILPAWSNEQRYAGFTGEYLQYGVSSIPVFSAFLSEEDGYRVAEEIIAPRKHDGVFCYCDDIAAGAIRKHNAPIRVIGFDGVRATDYLELSTVSQEPQMIGELASALIIDLIEGKGSGLGLIKSFASTITSK